MNFVLKSQNFNKTFAYIEKKQYLCNRKEICKTY